VTHRRRTAALAVAAALLLGCGALPDDRGGSPQPPSSPGGAPPAPSASPTDEFAEDVSGAIATVQEYWSGEFRADGVAFQPIRRVVPYHGSQGVRCADQVIGPNNAAYCSAGDFIAFDQDWLRRYFRGIGDAFVYFALGHEYGHAVQARLHMRFRLPVEAEQNADCLAGAYIGDSVRAKRLILESGDVEELQQGLVAVADPRDDWFAEDAHGTAEQRVAAFRKGYNESADACLEG
jgi:predicted metalloprotease